MYLHPIAAWHKEETIQKFAHMFCCQFMPLFGGTLCGAEGPWSCMGMNAENSEESAPGEIGCVWYSALEHIKIIYRETNGILYATNVFRYKSSLRANFLIVKNELHILQRTLTFSEQFWLHEKCFEKFFVR